MVMVESSAFSVLDFQEPAIWLQSRQGNFLRLKMAGKTFIRMVLDKFQRERHGRRQIDLGREQSFKYFK